MTVVVVEMSITFNDEFNHVYIRGEGTDKQDTLEAVTTVTEWVARDRECYIRVEPEVNSEKDFDTKVTRHRAWSRFSFRDQAGVRHKPDKDITVMGFGAA